MKPVAAYLASTFVLSWTAWVAAILTGSDAAVMRIMGTEGAVHADSPVVDSTTIRRVRGVAL